MRKLEENANEPSIIDTYVNDVSESDRKPKIMIVRSDDTMHEWSKDFIVKSLKKETELAEELFRLPRISTEKARMIADNIETKILAIYRSSKLKNGEMTIKTTMVRELVCFELHLLSVENIIYEKYREIYSRVGDPFYDVWNGIWQVKSFEQNENANLGSGGPENIHKKLADQVVKQALPIGLPIGIADAHYRGDIHIHQMEYPQRPFCSDYDLRWFFLHGLRADGNGIHSSSTGPAKHAESAVLHAVKVLAAGQCNCQGGQGLFNFNIFIAPYLEGMPYDDDGKDWETGKEPRTIKQIAQMFIFENNLTYVSRGGQLVFSSIQLEPTIPKIWKDKPVVYKGRIDETKTYGDFEKESQLFAKAILQTYIKGDNNGKMFFFPKPELKLRKEHFEYTDEKTGEIHKPSTQTTEIIKLAVELSAKFGSTYFDSVIPKYRDSEGQDCYQCCAYHFSEDVSTLEPKLWFKDGQHFSMSGQQVVSINMPRLAYRSKGNFDMFTDLLEEVMNTAKRFLIWKREKVLDFARRGNLPFLMQRPPSNPEQPTLYDIEASSLILGFVGMNEFAEAMTGFQLHEDPSAVEMAIKALLCMERIKNEFVERTGLNFAIARTPAESTAQTFAVKDLLLFEDIALNYVRGNKDDWYCKYKEYGRTGVPVYYTNGFMVNHSVAIDLDKKIDIEQKAFPILSGGDIFNVFLGEKFPDVDALYELTRKIALKTQIGYWSYTRDISLCNKCGFLFGGICSTCPSCNSGDVEGFSRITGYYQGIDAWNAGKVQELKDRYRFDI